MCATVASQQLWSDREEAGRKESEIVASPRLLKQLVQRGAFATMGCNRTVAEAVLSDRTELLFVLKANHLHLFVKARSALTEAAHSLFQTICVDHSSIDAR